MFKACNTVTVSENALNDLQIARMHQMKIDYSKVSVSVIVPNATTVCSKTLCVNGNTEWMIIKGDKMWCPSFKRHGIHSHRNGHDLYQV